MAQQISLQGAHDMVAALQAADIAASLDPAGFVPPGVWVQVRGFRPLSLGGYDTALALELVTADTDHGQAAASLVDLYNAVCGVLGEPRPATARTVLMPDGTRLPGLEIMAADSSPYTDPPA